MSDYPWHPTTWMIRNYCETLDMSDLLCTTVYDVTRYSKSCIHKSKLAKIIVLFCIPSYTPSMVYQSFIVWLNSTQKSTAEYKTDKTNRIYHLELFFNRCGVLEQDCYLYAEFWCRFITAVVLWSDQLIHVC